MATMATATVTTPTSTMAMATGEGRGGETVEEKDGLMTKHDVQVGGS